MEKTLQILIIVTLLSGMAAYASNEKNVKSTNNQSTTTIENVSYKHMTTVQLQQEVEKRSINGELSFEMGMELLKRWSKS